MEASVYKAFISYSHVDEIWAKWLHQALESYKVPKRLRSRDIPEKLFPIFRDRDELSTAADLSNKVQAALQNSDALIVVCSPASAKSRWVNEEIRLFRSLGRADRIFCVIVDGDPQASSVDEACFPPALLEDGVGESAEPLAADVRKWADGKALAKLKLISGILGLRLDQLRQREQQRKRKMQVLVGLGSIALFAIIVTAFLGQQSAKLRRDSGESLVAYKLNELRNLLVVEQDPEDLTRLSNWSSAELLELAGTAGSNPDSRLKSALSLRQAGILLWEKGNVLEALQSFENSWAMLALLYRENKSNQSLFFELGQAEFWIGQANLDLSELEKTEDAFMSYAEITRRLIIEQPENAEWVLEMTYALTNLGAAQEAQNHINPDRTLQLMQSALEYNQIALVLDPDNEYYRSELGQSHANLADAQLSVCDLEGALNSRKESLSLEQSIFNKEPESPGKMLRLSLALTGYAGVQANRGINADALDKYRQAVELIKAIEGKTVSGVTAVTDLIERQQHVIWLMANTGELNQAWEASNALVDDWQKLHESTSLEVVNTMMIYSVFLMERSWIAAQRGDKALAENILNESLALLMSNIERLPNNRSFRNLIARAAYFHWELTREQPADKLLSVLKDFKINSDRNRACVDASRAVSTAVMLGEPEVAEQTVGYLIDSGYGETGFMRICRTYYSCAEQ